MRAIKSRQSVASGILMAAVSMLLITASEAKAQQNDPPSYPGLSIEQRSHTVPSNRGGQRDAAQENQGYSGLMAAPQAQQQQRPVNRNRNAANPYAYGNAADTGTSGRVTDRQGLTAPGQEEEAATGPKPVEARFSASERQMNLIRNLREQRRQRNQNR